MTPANASRDKILARIREALQVQSPKPHRHHEPVAGAARGFSDVLPPTGKTTEEQFALFAKNAADLRAEFRLVNGHGELRNELSRLASAEKWTRLATHRGRLTDGLVDSLGLPVLFTDGGFDKNELEVCSAGITECDALVAQTGTVVVTSRTAGGRALSCLPPHHVVLARRQT